MGWGSKLAAGVVGVCTLISASVSTAAAHEGEEHGPQLQEQNPDPLPEPVAAAALAADGEPYRVLIYGPTAGGLAELTPGTEVTVWDEATWSSKTTAEFAAFDAIVFADVPECFSEPDVWDTAVANRQVWSAAIDGNVIINGTDPDFHG